MSQRKEAAVQAVISAYVDPGVMPGYHYAMLAQLREQWPTMHNALIELVRADREDRKP